MHTNSLFELEDGFYYQKDDGDWEGPFASLQIAQTAYDFYLRWSEDDKHKEIKKLREDMGL
jgi:hypothetical protein